MALSWYYVKKPDAFFLNRNADRQQSKQYLFHSSFSLIAAAAGLGALAFLAALGARLSPFRHFSSGLRLVAPLGLAVDGLQSDLRPDRSDRLCAADLLHHCSVLRSPESLSSWQKQQPVFENSTGYPRKQLDCSCAESADRF